MKHVQAGLSARDDRESSFYQCGGPVSLVHACICEGNPNNADLNFEKEL